MRKVFLENLPTNKHNKISWKDSKGLKVKFIYDDINGELEIKNVKGESLEIIYEDYEYTISQTNFKRGKLYNVVNKIYNSYDFKYNIGDVIETNSNTFIIILERYKNPDKTYKVKCKLCNKTHQVKESFINRKSTPVCCSKRKILQGVNNLNTTHPHLSKFLFNIEDGNNVASGSNKKIKAICPNCKSIKMIEVHNLVQNGFSCHSCSDGFSFPNKLMFNLLKNIQIEFIPEFSPQWIKPKRFDFAIPSLKVIIEMDGYFHFDNTTYSNSTKVIENDKLKEKIALEHGYSVIRINCKESDFTSIQKHILNSNLKRIIPLEKVNWEFVYKKSLTSTVIEVCELKSEYPNISPSEISKLLNINVCTVIKYLKIGNKLKMCHYNSTDEQRKNSKEIFVYDNTTNIIHKFKSIAELERKSLDIFNVKFSHIGEVTNKMENGRISFYKNKYFFSYNILRLQRLSERTSQRDDATV